MGDHPPDDETGGSGPPITDKDVPRELDNVLCYHRTSRLSDQGTVLVQDGRPHIIYESKEGRG